MNTLARLTAALLALAFGMALADTSAEAPAEPAPPETRYFWFYLSPGPAWDPEKRVFQQDWDAHLQYTRQLSEAGQLVLGGPFKDDTGAFGIMEAANLEEATALAEADPAVLSGLVTVEVRPWHPVVIRPMGERPW